MEVKILGRNGEGEFFVDRATGEVMSLHVEDNADILQFAIVSRFNIKSYLQVHNLQHFPDGVSVQDIGYWRTDGQYIDPEGPVAPDSALEPEPAINNTPRPLSPPDWDWLLEVPAGEYIWLTKQEKLAILDQPFNPMRFEQRFQPLMFHREDRPDKQEVWLVDCRGEGLRNDSPAGLCVQPTVPESVYHAETVDFAWYARLLGKPLTAEVSESGAARRRFSVVGRGEE